MKRRLSVLLACLMGMSCLWPSTGLAAQVEVYAEGAYTATDLAVYVYADITGPAILSFGVKLTYDPLILTVSSAEKNEAVWYMGDGANNHEYMDPETGTSGEVVIIGGKVNTAAPTAGVSGTRVLLGKVFFNRTESSIPFSPAITLTYGRGDGTVDAGYKNFVATDATVMDVTNVALAATPTIHQRGDANGDGAINALDLRTLRQVIGLDAPCWADCNGDEDLNALDLRCLRIIM